MKRYQLLFASLCFGGMLIGLQKSSAVDRFVEYAKLHSGEMAVTGYGLSEMPPANHVWNNREERKAQARDQILAEAAKRRIPPVNATVDRVWKAIPGYNGLEVDVEKTMQLNEQQSFPNPPKLVFREVPPEVSLEQLGAQPIYKGNPSKRMVGLMINVAWGNEYLAPMLETLRKENVHATFFFDGSWLKKNIPTARKIIEAGHEAGNHAYTHKDMSKLGREQATSEISRTEALLKNELGLQNKLFAPPSGDFNQSTVEIAHDMKLKTILWTIDTVDWMKPSPETIVRKISTRVEPGSLILMHPTDSSNRALQQMIREIKNKGLALGTVSEVISPSRIPEVESTLQ
ncbi:polysaccharide deacetylase family protein [Paenibacillus cremeus]|uniref:Polysaccharide deacetylase family protein n=1 Tax=Paenibacillus cremeus TaxID=2163881 RepID=A0A559KER0_9BACL|nr:polysaccharide deacetylase family protein [Paenibacillus cremeus]TVY10608.1 polysaccharide deacetylase family protein [Paenibacillus cremeus]